MSNEVASTLLQQSFLFSKTEKFCQCHFFFFLQGILHFHETFPFSIRKGQFRHDAIQTTSFNTLVTTIRQQQFETQFIKMSIMIARKTQFKTLHFNLIGQFVLLNGGTGGHVYVSMRNGENEENWKNKHGAYLGWCSFKAFKDKNLREGEVMLQNKPW